MTGELHHLLLTHSPIGAGLPEQQAALAALSRRAGAAARAAPAVLPQLFETRAVHPLGALAWEQVSEYLSGLLIGAEVASMRAFIAGRTGYRDRCRPVPPRAISRHFSCWAAR